MRRNYLKRMEKMELRWREQFNREKKRVDDEVAKLRIALHRMVTVDGQWGRDHVQFVTKFAMDPLFAWGNAGSGFLDERDMKRFMAMRLTDHVHECLMNMDLSKMQHIDQVQTQNHRTRIRESYFP